MSKSIRTSRALAAALAAVLWVQAPALRAEIVDTDTLAAQTTAQQDRAKVQSFMERASVKERLQAMGVDGLSAHDRVAALNDDEVHALAQRIDAMPAGGNLSHSDLIIILLIAILVVVAV